MIPLGAVNSIVYMLLPLAILFIQVLTGSNGLLGLFFFAGTVMALLVLSAGYHALQWAFYTYRYEEGYLHIKSGVVSKKERSIKRERVQTVNIKTGIIQRLMGLASLQVETAGGGMESELNLVAVKMEEAHQIKEALEKQGTVEITGKEGSRWELQPEMAGSVESPREEAGEKEHAGEDGEVWEKGEVYRVSYSELFLAGATSGNFLILFSLMLAAFSQVQPHIPPRYWDYLLEQVTSTTAATVVLVVVALMFLSWLVSAAVFTVQNANFTVRRLGERMQVSWGLIEQKQLTLKMHRLQALSIHEGLLRQPLGRCALTVEVAGGGSRDENYVTLLFPLLRCSELEEFLRRILPEYRLPEEVVPLPLRSRRRYIFRAVAPVVILLIPLQFVPYGWLGFILLPPAFWLGLSRYRAGGTSIEKGQLMLRYRNLNRFRVLIHRQHIQSLQVTSNPFQRWRKLRSVEASVLSSPSGKSFQVTDVDKEEAVRLWKWYSRY